MIRLMYTKHLSFSNFNNVNKWNWNFCCSCGNVFKSTENVLLPSSRWLSTTPNTDIPSYSEKPKRKKRTKKNLKVELIQVNGSSLSNKKATVKNLTTKHLENFVESSEELVAEPKSSKVPDGKTTFEKYSIINVKPFAFGTNEIADEGPLFFAGKTFVRDPKESLQEIIESYKIFREMSSVGDVNGEEEQDFHYDKEDISVINEPDLTVEEVVKPAKKVKKTRKKKQKLAEPADNKQKNVTKYKSKYHKCVEDEHLAKQKSLEVNLASYLQVCVENGNTDRGYQSLIFYRNKYKKYKTDIELFNIVLGGYAEKANIHKINDVLSILKNDNIQCNAQSYAAIFECLGRSEDNRKTKDWLRNFRKDALANGISLNDIVDLSKFTGDKREIVIETIRKIEPEFEPIYTPPELKYNNCLVDALNEHVQPIDATDFPTSGCEILNDKRNFTQEEYQQMLTEQLQVERNGTVKVRSIQKFNENADVLDYVSVIEIFYFRNGSPNTDDENEPKNTRCFPCMKVGLQN
ncbi:DNA-directed RNA polymerase, mitochondrial [Pseudolycoriella hygida]|uniref:DNA-directed RNA polymerase, mitochondrial n=1 Tax=Pseudolycoriella hygida TaxID=35572 RepID=A0A9Q0MLA9_9DIPT|nr:DNA-directed RNA polymerase, mitochondrial [Pseudolycoriella hygida]